MKAKYINPYTDFGFKKLFGEKASKETANCQLSIVNGDLVVPLSPDSLIPAFLQGF